MYLDRQKLIDDIIEAVREADQKNYLCGVLRMDIGKLLDDYKRSITEYNYDVIEQAKAELNHGDWSYYSDIDLLEEVQDRLYH